MLIKRNTLISHYEDHPEFLLRRYYVKPLYWIWGGPAVWSYQNRIWFFSLDHRIVARGTKEEMYKRFDRAAKAWEKPEIPPRVLRPRITISE